MPLLLEVGGRSRLTRRPRVPAATAAPSSGRPAPRAASHLLGVARQKEKGCRPFSREGRERRAKGGSKQAVASSQVGKWAPGAAVITGIGLPWPPAEDRPVRGTVSRGRKKV